MEEEHPSEEEPPQPNEKIFFPTDKSIRLVGYIQFIMECPADDRFI